MKSARNNGKAACCDDASTLLQVARTRRQPFTLDDLSVAAWEAHPNAFGMADYPYPDKHKVHGLVYGNDGMIATGVLRELEPGLLRVSDPIEPDANSP